MSCFVLQCVGPVCCFSGRSCGTGFSQVASGVNLLTLSVFFFLTTPSEVLGQSFAGQAESSDLWLELETHFPKLRVLLHTVFVAVYASSSLCLRRPLSQAIPCADVCCGKPSLSVQGSWHQRGLFPVKHCCGEPEAHLQEACQSLCSCQVCSLCLCSQEDSERLRANDSLCMILVRRLSRARRVVARLPFVLEAASQACKPRRPKRLQKGCKIKLEELGNTKNEWSVVR